MTHFLDLWTHWIGESEIPESFVEWGGRSLAAASLHDQLYYDFCGNRIQGNLFVALIGHSGAGKEAICKKVARFGQVIGPLNCYMGSLTNSALYDALNGDIDKWKEKVGARYRPGDIGMAENIHRMYLVMEEASNCLKSKDLARELVTTMTAMYNPSAEITHFDMTRTSGMKALDQCSLNWLVGSTATWFEKKMCPDDIEGGFFVRMFMIHGEKNHEKRISFPKRPPNVSELRGQIEDRLRAYNRLWGQVTLSEEATAIYDDWYQHRTPAPGEGSDIIEKPLFEKRSGLIFKFALLECVMSWDPSTGDEFGRVITGDHMREAERMYGEVRKHAVKAKPLVFGSPLERCVTWLSEWLKGRYTQGDYKGTKRSPAREQEALKIAANQHSGMGGRKLVREAIQYLEECGQMVRVDGSDKRTNGGTPGEWYWVWTGD